MPRRRGPGTARPCGARPESCPRPGYRRRLPGRDLRDGDACGVAHRFPRDGDPRKKTGRPDAHPLRGATPWSADRRDADPGYAARFHLRSPRSPRPSACAAAVASPAAGRASRTAPGRSRRVRGRGLEEWSRWDRPRPWPRIPPPAARAISYRSPELPQCRPRAGAVEAQSSAPTCRGWWGPRPAAIAPPSRPRRRSRAQPRTGIPASASAPMVFISTAPPAISEAIASASNGSTSRSSSSSGLALPGVRPVARKRLITSVE